MTDQDTRATTRRARGTGFPSLPLDEAARAIKNAGKYGRTHADAAFAGYLGHDTTNSGPFRAKMASLRDWGLIERPSDGQVPLTDLGQHLAHPASPDDELRRLREAFFNAKPFADIYNESAKEQDLSVDSIGNRAVTTLGVSAPSKQRFADSFAKSVVAAGLGRMGAKGSIQLIPPGTVDVEDAEAGTGTDLAVSGTQPGDSDLRNATIPARQEPVQSAGAPPTVHQEYPVAGGLVLFEVRLDRALPGTAFGAVAEVITAVERFVQSLGPPDGTHDHKATDGAAE